MQAVAHATWQSSDPAPAYAAETQARGFLHVISTMEAVDVFVRDRWYKYIICTSCKAPAAKPATLAIASKQGRTPNLVISNPAWPSPAAAAWELLASVSGRHPRSRLHQ